VEIQGFVTEEALVEDHAHAPGAVIDDAERRDRAGDDAEELAHELRPAEREPRTVDPLVQALHVNICVFLGDDQKNLVFLVLQEEILGVASSDLAAQRLALLDREEGRVLDCGGGDPVLREKGKKVGAAGGHGAFRRVRERIGEAA
jgi:hypothetical protein